MSFAVRAADREEKSRPTEQLHWDASRTRAIAACHGLERNKTVQRVKKGRGRLRYAEKCSWKEDAGDKEVSTGGTSRAARV